MASLHPPGHQPTCLSPLPPTPQRRGEAVGRGSAPWGGPEGLLLGSRGSVTGPQAQA